MPALAGFPGQTGQYFVGGKIRRHFHHLTEQPGMFRRGAVKQGSQPGVAAPPCGKRQQHLDQHGFAASAVDFLLQAAQQGLGQDQVTLSHIAGQRGSSDQFRTSGPEVAQVKPAGQDQTTAQNRLPASRQRLFLPVGNEQYGFVGRFAGKRSAPLASGKPVTGIGKYPVRQGETAPGRPLPGRLLKHHMGVAAAKAKAAHPRPTGQGAALPIHGNRPGLALPHQIKGAVLQFDIGIDRCAMQGRRQLPRRHGEQNLDDAGQTGGRLKMTNIGFDGTKADAGPLLSAFQYRVGKAQAIDFNRIPETGAGPVGFDVSDALRGNSGHRLLDKFGLGLGVGRRQGTGMTAVIHRTAGNHTENLVAVPLGSCPFLENEHDHALAPHIAVGLAGEGTAAAGRTEHTGLPGSFEPLNGQGEIDAARQGHGTPAMADGIHRPHQSHQRTGTGGIHRFTRPVHIELPGNPVGDHGQGITRGDLGIAGDSAGLQQPPVVLAADSDKNSGIGRQFFHPVTGLLEAAPGGFQEQALLRIHAAGFVRRRLEKRAVKAVNIGQETPLQRETTGLHARPVRGRISVERQLPDQIMPLQKALEKLFSAGRSRQTGSQANNRHIPARRLPQGQGNGFKGSGGSREQRTGSRYLIGDGFWRRQPGRQPASQSIDMLALVENGRRQGTAILGIDFTGQPGQGNGVESQIIKWRARIDVIDRKLEHARHHLPQAQAECGLGRIAGIADRNTGLRAGLRSGGGSRPAAVQADRQTRQGHLCRQRPGRGRQGQARRAGQTQTRHGRHHGPGLVEDKDVPLAAHGGRRPQQDMAGFAAGKGKLGDSGEGQTGCFRVEKKQQLPERTEHPGRQCQMTLEGVLLRMAAMQGAQDRSFGQLPELVHDFQIRSESQLQRRQVLVKLLTAQSPFGTGPQAIQGKGRQGRRKGFPQLHTGIRTALLLSVRTCQFNQDLAPVGQHPGGKSSAPRPVRYTSDHQMTQGRPFPETGQPAYCRHHLDHHGGQQRRLAVAGIDVIEELVQIDRSLVAQTVAVGTITGNEGMQFEAGAEGIHHRRGVGIALIPAAYPLKGIARQRNPPPYPSRR